MLTVPQIMEIVKKMTREEQKELYHRIGQLLQGNYDEPKSGGSVIR